MEKYLTYKGAARWFDERGVPLAETTLRRAVCDGRGPAHVKLKKRVLFTERDLQAFLDRRRVECPA